MKAMQRVYKGVGVILIILGIVSLIFGGIGVFDIIEGFEEPSEVSIETVDLDQDIETVSLPEGEYEVWIEGEEVIDLTVEDEEGNSVFQRDTTQSITIDGRSYEKIGNLQIEEDGNYTFQSDQEGTIYITEPISVLPGIFKTCGLIVFGILALILGVIVFVLNLGKSDDEERYGKY